jgi:hypothetical protein
VQSRLDGVENMVGESGPLSVHAQEIYRALSDADATAAAALLVGGLEPPAVRQRYERDIAQATAALAAAADLGGGADASAGPLRQISTNLPVYTGLVETARVYNRQGFPLGAAYLREASGVMRGQLLPAAEQLYEVESARLDADERKARATIIPDLLLGLLLLGALVAAQRYLTRRTNRLINVGLAVASGAALISLLWTTVALVSSAGDLRASSEEGSDHVQLLVEARTAALEARGDEGLTLVARGAGEAFEENYVKVSQEFGGRDGSGGLLGRALADAPDATARAEVQSAISNARAWRTAHAELRRRDEAGRYDEAVRIAIGPEETSAGSAFSRLDQDLAEAITNSQGNFLTAATQARGALAVLPLGVLVLMVVTVAGVGVGLWRRIAEYS